MEVMKAILIDPVTQTIAPYTVDHRLKTLQAAVGGLIAIATTLDTGDVLYVNDEGLLTDQPRFFTLAGAHQPFPGRAILVGQESLGIVTDVVSTIDRIRELVSFDVHVDLDEPLKVRTVTFDSADEFLDYLRRIQHRPIKTR